MALSQKALVLLEEKGEWTVVSNWPISSPGRGEILVKVISAALNPVDWIIQTHGHPLVNHFPVPGGFDGTGIVEEVHADVSHLVKGDKVLFQGGIGDPARATFQQYAICAADNAAKIPDNVSFDQAASVPLGLATAVVGLWAHHPEASSVDFPAPWEEGGLTKFAGQAAFIVGGSSSVGQYAIQMARLQNFSPIIATASTRHEDFLKSLGATYVIDRSLSADTVLQEVTKLTGGKPAVYAYAAVSDLDNQNLAYDALAHGGSLVVTNPFSEAFLAAKVARDGASKKIARPRGGLKLPGNKELGVELYSRLTDWLETGVLVPNRVEVLPGGLAGVAEGLDRIKNGKVSGVKLVVNPQDTV